MMDLHNSALGTAASDKILTLLAPLFIDPPIVTNPCLKREQTGISFVMPPRS
jgi:hypothetical protein